MTARGIDGPVEAASRLRWTDHQVMSLPSDLAWVGETLVADREWSDHLGVSALFELVLVGEGGGWDEPLESAAFL